MILYLSGCHAGPNPSPGLGMARSLRAAFPDAHLIGKDHSLGCSALHHPVFDEVWVCRPWAELDLEHHRAQLTERLAHGALYLSGLDLEVVWLSLQRVPGAIVPPAPALAAARKPTWHGFTSLPGVRLPPSCPANADPEALTAFARRHGWPVWIKGAWYDAKQAAHWRELVKARSELTETWGPDGLHLQAAVRGTEVSIAFCAAAGALIEAVYMEKRQVVEQGKTWAGEVRPVEQPMRSALARCLAAIAWTGGGEIEFVRDAQGTHWLIDVNPRFPAWIHGATLSGYNLPGLLVSTMAHRPARQAVQQGVQFIRVVEEIPVAEHLALPALAERPRTATDASLGKHPSGMPQLVRRLQPSVVEPPPHASEAAPSAVTEAAQRVADPTPFRSFDLDGAADRMRACVGAVAALGGRVAYSVKTNPGVEVLSRARSSGALAEVISPAERALALRCGFASEQIVYNGPLPLTGPLTCYAAFADSVQSLQGLTQHVHGCIGPRARPFGVRSRFGVDFEDLAETTATTRLLQRCEQPIGISMHLQSSGVGVPRWLDAVRSVIAYAAMLQDQVGRPLALVDLGGGWSPEDTLLVLDELLPEITAAVHTTLGAEARLLVEPGKLLVDDFGALTTQVLEVRADRRTGPEVVVDASIAELPTSSVRPRSVWAVRDGQPVRLGPGNGRILGRLCLEADVLREDVHLPAWLTNGDRLVLGDCGAYDTSMAWPFGQGVAHPTS
jgi:diaminopimelate decarboxylase